MLPSSGVIRPFKPHWTPRRGRIPGSSVTTRASTSTCGSGRSRLVMRAWAVCSRSGRSVMMTVFVRASTWICPRCDSADLVSSDIICVCLRVAQREGLHPQVAGERFRFRQLPPLAFLVRQHRDRGDADDGAFGDVAQLVRAQQRLEGLVPGDVAQHDVDGRRRDRRIDDDVQPADLVEVAQHRSEIGAREVQRDRVPLYFLSLGPEMSCAAVGGGVAGACWRGAAAAGAAAAGAAATAGGGCRQRRAAGAAAAAATAAGGGAGATPERRGSQRRDRIGRRGLSRGNGRRVGDRLGQRDVRLLFDRRRGARRTRSAARTSRPTAPARRPPRDRGRPPRRARRDRSRRRRPPSRPASRAARGCSPRPARASPAVRPRCVCARAFDATFGKSSTSRRGRSRLSVTSAGVSRPLPPRVTVVAPAAALAWTRSRMVASGVCCRRKLRPPPAAESVRAALASAGPAADRSGAVSSSRISVARAAHRVLGGPGERDAHAGQRLAVGRARLLERDRRRSHRGARRGSRRWRPRRCAARRAASADRAA